MQKHKQHNICMICIFVFCIFFDIFQNVFGKRGEGLGKRGEGLGSEEKALGSGEKAWEAGRSPWEAGRRLGKRGEGLGKRGEGLGSGEKALGSGENPWEAGTNPDFYTYMCLCHFLFVLQFYYKSSFCVLHSLSFCLNHSCLELFFQFYMLTFWNQKF